VFEAVTAASFGTSADAAEPEYGCSDQERNHGRDAVIPHV
jgi:hypothetical protein